MKCLKCGMEVSDEQTVCPNCGEAIKTEVPSDDGNKETVENTQETVENTPKDVDKTQSNGGVDDFFEFKDNPEGTSSDNQSPETANVEETKDENKAEENNNKEDKKEQKERKTAPKKQRKGSVVGAVFGTLIVIVIALIVGVIMYYKIMNTPKGTFKRGLNLVSNKLLYITRSNSSKVSTSISFKADAPVQSENSLLNLLSKISFNIDADRDYQNHLLLSNISVNYNQKSLFNGQIYAENKDLYIFSNDLSDKWLKSSYETDLISQNNKDMKAYKNIVNELFNALDASLKNSYFKAYKENVDGEDVIKNELVIDDNNIKVIEKDIYTYLYHSNRFIKAICNYTDKKEEDIKKSLKEQIDIYSKPKTKVTIGRYVFDIYTKGFKNEFVKFTMQDQSGSSLKIAKKDDNNYDIISNSGTYLLNITNKDDQKVYIFKCNNANVTFTIEFKETYGKDIVKPNITNVGELSQELMNIASKLQTNEAYSMLSNDLGSYMLTLLSLSSNLQTVEVDESEDNNSSNTIDGNNNGGNNETYDINMDQFNNTDTSSSNKNNNPQNNNSQYNTTQYNNTQNNNYSNNGTISLNPDSY